jgi:hypothetical protein
MGERVEVARDPLQVLTQVLVGEEYFSSSRLASAAAISSR